MEITSITAALSGIKNAAAIAKIIKDSGASLEQAEIKLKLADLIGALADAKIEIANVREAISEKDMEIANLNKKLDLKENIKWEEPYYFILSGEEKDGPYCQKCYDSKKLLIRLQNHDIGYWSCNECNSNYTDKDFKEEESVQFVPNNDYL